MEIILQAFAYDPDTGKRLNVHPFINKALPLGMPIPRIKDYVAFQYWMLEVFKVEYAYTDTKVFVEVKAYINNEECKKELTRNN